MQLRLQQTVQVNPSAQWLEFLVWMCVIFKFTSLKSFTPISITLWGLNFIYKIFGDIFGLFFLLKHSRDSPFLGYQMDLFLKLVYIPHIPLNLISKKIEFLILGMKRKTYGQNTNGVSSRQLRNRAGVVNFWMPYWTYIANLFQWYIPLWI